jgi:N-6 DNA Methylase/Eco57I restriction-modification methylase
MIPGLSGSLLSHEALAEVVPRVLNGLLGEAERDAARRSLRAWHLPLRAHLGPALSLRAIYDRLAEPLFAGMGYHVVPVDSPSRGTRVQLRPGTRAVLSVSGVTRATLFVTHWGDHSAATWRDTVRLGISQNGRWCFCLSGPRLRIVDSSRTYSRQFAEFDLEMALDREETFAVFWGLLRGAAMEGSGDARPLLERAIELTEQHRASVRSSLQHGVHDALTHLTRALSGAASTRHAASSAAVSAFDEALVVIYRILFLLFAEARGLVPRWHPIYRDGYTIESLRTPVETLPAPVGIWETLQAIARLAHRGCRIGSLHVPPFNGRLFSPVHAPLADSVPLDDRVVRSALLALTTRTGPHGCQHIAYGDLGVEQLGGVYERLLDFDPASNAGRARVPGLLVRGERRKSTGAFYTPRPLTEYLVRRALAPLVATASPESILALRVLDPAMGSGAFLVAACRYLAAAYEAALVREGGVSTDDISDVDRAEYRRAIAQRCLYGVDINPMAVQLGRLSLWLATLSADRPLTFLDHRLRTGNSLVGASATDMSRQAPGAGRRAASRALPLFEDGAHDIALREAIAVRSRIATEPGDTLEQVRAKEHALAALTRSDAPVERWKEVCDLWCSAWFPTRNDRAAVPFGALADQILGRGNLPVHVAEPLVAESRNIAARERFFHWTFEFPEIFCDARGEPLSSPGFDAIIGNPPWEMLRGDRGDAVTRDAARTTSEQLTAFARGSGVYRAQGDGIVNLYQLFIERTLALLRSGGRLGMVLPSGLATDHGAANLRRALLDRTRIDNLVSLENREAMFPVHRSLKFLLLSATAGGRSAQIPCRFGIQKAEALDGLPELGPDPDALTLARPLLERLSGDQIALPDIRSAHDVDILGKIAFTAPALGDADGWAIRFGRELNATDDRRYFSRGTDGMPIIEGKHVRPFTVDVAGASKRIRPDVAATLVDPAQTFGRARLGYREVAAATNRLTLIAAVLPEGTITTHTVFCLKVPLDVECQWYLCGMFNSFVANYLVRMRVSTHVSSGIIDRLRVPLPARDAPRFREIAALSASMATSQVPLAVQARLHALAAREYDLQPGQFHHILNTFPLVPRAERDAALAAFCDIVL